MNLNGINRVCLAACTLSVVLSGCAGINDGTTQNIPLVVSAQTSVLSNTDDSLIVEGVGKVLIGQRYTAASGRTCRKLLSMDGQPLSVRQCWSGSGQWSVTRNIAASQPFQ